MYSEESIDEAMGLIKRVSILEGWKTNIIEIEIVHQIPITIVLCLTI